MTTIEAGEILADYKFSHHLIRHYVDGVTDHEAMLPLPFEANCMNWLLEEH